MPRGRPASLPIAEVHRRPALSVGLNVTHVNEKGTKSAEYDFSKLPLTFQFQNELAEVFSARANPTGLWRNLPSSKQGFWAISYFARWLARQDKVPSSIADISPVTWLEWRLAHLDNVGSRRALRLTRMLLLESELLKPETRYEAIRRTPRDKPQEESYSDDELRRITIAAKGVWRIARDRIRSNAKHLEHYRSGAFERQSQDDLIGIALDCIAETGDVPRTNWKDKPPEPWVARALGGGHREQTWKRLYLDDAEVMAVVILLACKEGWNETTIQEIKVPERLDGGGVQPVYRVELEKRRRRPPHRYETRTLTDNAPDATARLFRNILEVTQPAREVLKAHGYETDRLLISHRGQVIGADVQTMFLEGISSHAHVNFTNLTGQKVSLRRIRKTVNNRHRREPNQNTRGTHETVYLLTDPHTIQESEGLIAGAIERSVSAAEGFVLAVKGNNSDEGEETPTATCLHPQESPFSPWGVACRASFLLCLACHNAVVMPKHLGRLAYLHQLLTCRRESIPPETWAKEWAAHYDRLHNLRTDHYSEGQWLHAVEALSRKDRELVDYLLKGTLDV